MNKYVKYNRSFLSASLEHLGLSWPLCLRLIYTHYSGNRDVVNLTSDGEYILHDRMNEWKDIHESYMKIFIGHLILMGIVKKSQIAKYWSRNVLTETPYFGKTMMRNQFLLIMKNLHLVNNMFDDKSDELFKIHPFVKMCDGNFKYVYTCKLPPSVDEACCEFRGKVKFCVYNSKKPQEFHMKLYQLCESQSGYAVAFEIYTGSESKSVHTCKMLDKTVNKTCKLVMGLLENSCVLDVGYKVYFDNYYTSMDLMHELLSRYIFACGTVCANRKGLPVAVTKSKLKKGESVFRRKGEILCLKHHDRREVCLLSTIHDANEVLVKNRFVLKPEATVAYNQHMSGCDLADQLMTSYSFLRCNLKWWRKLFFHLLLLLLNNAYILNKKFGNVSLNHEQCLECIAKYLIDLAIGIATEALKQSKVYGQVDTEKRLSERHFPSCLQEQPMSKHTKPA